MRARAFLVVWGIGTQPASETVEVAFYAGFAALARWARPEPAR